MSTMTRAVMRAAGTPTPACSSDPDAMFPAADSERPGERNAAELAALAVCASCAFLEPCAEAALTAEMPYGVLGGMTVADRRAIRAVRRGLAALPLESTVTARRAPGGDQYRDAA